MAGMIPHRNPSDATTGRTSDELQDGRDIHEILRLRIHTLEYLKRVHEGNVFYLGGVSIPSDGLAVMYESHKLRKRTLRWLNLGLSIGSLLALSNSVDFAKALNSVMSDFENEPGDNGSTGRTMRQLFSRRNRVNADGIGDSSNSFLEFAHVPIEVDYVQTFTSLCEVLLASYKKIGRGASTQGSNLQLIEPFSKADAKVKKILAVVLRELDVVAKNMLKEELSSIDEMF
ncbi:hypothetical protein BJ742DRAFT_831534 [Cladochytrium replicatum]|nr:hypothetical protein BJ742DRAFT_831534 [Cladochytrium replicatum]